MKSVIASLLVLSSSICAAVEVSESAPNCHLSLLSNAKPVQLANPGKVTFIDFWASWCGPCEKSMPFLETINTELKGKDFKLIAVNLDESKKDADHFLKKHKVNLTIAADPDNECANTYGVTVMPSSYLIDKKGKVRHVLMGFNEEDKKEVRELINKLLAE